MAGIDTSATITAQNTFTTPVYIKKNEGYSVSVSGTYVATVVVQRSRDGNTWFDVASQTAPFEADYRPADSFYYRVGVKTGGFTSGSVVVNTY